MTLFGTQFQLSKIEDFSIKIVGNNIKPVTVRNFGYFMDSQMKRKEHISSICIYGCAMWHKLG